jgi:hypothetical protein
MEVTSNAVDAVTIFWLPDQMEEIISAAPVSFQGTVAGSGAPVALAVPIEEASSNGQSIVRFVYQNSPGIPAATGGLALGAVQGGNSPQPLYSIGACVRAGSGLIGWWQAENNSNDSAGNNPGQTPHNMAYVPGEVGQAFSLNGSSQSVQIPYATNLVTTGLTVEVWINPTHTISSQAFVFGQAYGRQLIVRPGTTGVGVGFLVTSTNGTFYGVYRYPNRAVDARGGDLERDQPHALFERRAGPQFHVIPPHDWQFGLPLQHRRDDQFLWLFRPVLPGADRRGLTL